VQLLTSDSPDKGIMERFRVLLLLHIAETEFTRMYNIRVHFRRLTRPAVSLRHLISESEGICIVRRPGRRWPPHRTAEIQRPQRSTNTSLTVQPDTRSRMHPSRMKGGHAGVRAQVWGPHRLRQLPGPDPAHCSPQAIQQPPVSTAEPACRAQR
jgi:hypothetical protein